MTFDKRNMALGLLLGAGMVAMAAGAVAQGAPPLPPAPPEPAAAVAPPAPPAPPIPPETPDVQVMTGQGTRVVIVERDGKRGEAAHVRTAMRDGKTFVFKTDHPLSDAEFEHRIAEAERGIPPVPPVPPVAGLSDGHQKHRVIVMRDSKRGAQTIIDADKIERDAMMQAINGIRSAREAIAGNTALSDDVRREVLQELDAEIAKLRAKS